MSAWAVAAWSTSMTAMDAPTITHSMLDLCSSPCKARRFAPPARARGLRALTVPARRSGLGHYVMAGSVMMLSWTNQWGQSESGSGIAIASALSVGVGLRGAATSESRSPLSGALSVRLSGPCPAAICGLKKLVRAQDIQMCGLRCNPRVHGRSTNRQSSDLSDNVGISLHRWSAPAMFWA